MDAEGESALDRPEAEGGERKRAHGSRKGTLCILGDPRAHKASDLTLTEGIADALALASRYMATSAAFRRRRSEGRGGGAGRLVRYLDGHDPLADRDAPGVRTGWELRDACAEAGFDLHVKLLPPGYKDAAAAAAPLGTLDMELVRELTRDLQEKDGLPQWEAARVAVLTT